MSNTDSDPPEKRVHTRAQYFLLNKAGEKVPVFAFRDGDEIAAIPALIVDISDGGVQILSTNTAGVDQRTYSLEIVTGEASDAIPENRHAVHHVWSRPDGVNIRSGFSFGSGAAALEALNERLSAAEHHLLRCVLHPIS